MPEPPFTSSATIGTRPSQLFTVRVWVEDLGEGRSEWRGQVQHVLSGSVRHFRDWAVLVAALQEMLDAGNA